MRTETEEALFVQNATIVELGEENLRAWEALHDCGFDIVGKTLAESIQILKMMNKDLAIQVVDRGESFAQLLRVSKDVYDHFKDHLPVGEWSQLFAVFPPFRPFSEMVSKLTE